MAALQTGLGRGLGALFQEEPEETAPAAEGTLKYLPISSVVPNLGQPRRHFDDEALNGLAESIKSQGVLQPILVKPIKNSQPPKFQIVAGERRWRASSLAGLSEVPVIIKELEPQETLAIALIENLQREDLNPLEEAVGIQQLKADFGMSQEQLSQTLGKSRSAIANSLRLLKLSAKAQAALKSGIVSAGHARALLSLEQDAEQDELLDKIVNEGLTVREAEGWAATRKAGAVNEVSIDKPAESVPGNIAPVSGQGTKKLPQSAIMLDLQKRLSESIGLPVRFSGQESRGKLSISYSSKEELAAILQKIGINAEL